MGLIVTRKNGQTVILDGTTKITVICPVKVKLKIEAPKQVKVLRGELERKAG